MVVSNISASGRGESTSSAEASRRTKHQIYNSARPFEPHRYMIEELIGTAEWELSEDDDYEPSFFELCEAADKWRSGDYHELYQFND